METNIEDNIKTIMLDEDTNLTQKIEAVANLKTADTANWVLIDETLTPMLKELILETITYKGPDCMQIIKVSLRVQNMALMARLIRKIMTGLYKSYIADGECELEDYVYWITYNTNNILDFEISVPHMFIGPYTYNQIVENKFFKDDIDFNARYGELLQSFIHNNAVYIEE